MWSATWSIVASGLGCVLAQSAENRLERDEVPGVDAHLAAAAAASTRHSAVAGETNSGTKVTMQTPPLAGSAASTSSGTLRGVSHRGLGRRVAEDHGGVGRVEGRRIVVAATWLRSTIIPRRFISRTTSRPNSVSPPTRGASVAESAHGVLSLCVRVR